MWLQITGRTTEDEDWEIDAALMLRSNSDLLSFQNTPCGFSLYNYFFSSWLDDILWTRTTGTAHQFAQSERNLSQQILLETSGVFCFDFFVILLFAFSHSNVCIFWWTHSRIPPVFSKTLQWFCCEMSGTLETRQPHVSLFSLIALLDPSTSCGSERRRRQHSRQCSAWTIGRAQLI